MSYDIAGHDLAFKKCILQFGLGTTRTYIIRTEFNFRLWFLKFRLRLQMPRLFSFGFQLWKIRLILQEFVEIEWSSWVYFEA